jgi:hypothetical protein
MKLEDRVITYNLGFGSRFPGSQLSLTGNQITGIWMIGNAYKNTSRLYGAYPPHYLDRIADLFQDIPRSEWVHVFAGSVKEGITIDVNSAHKPDICCDVEELSNHFPGKAKIILADPPYSHADAEKYHYPLPHKKKVIEECYKITEPGAFLVWLDTSFPMFRKKEWKLVGTIGIIRSTNHRVRMVFIWERQE